MARSGCIRGFRPNNRRLGSVFRQWRASGRQVAMKSLGRKPDGLRLERAQSSPLWNGGTFRNMHPLLPRLLQAKVAAPTVSAFLFDGDRRVPKGPLPSMDPRAQWSKKPRTGLRATWLGHSTVLIEIDGLRVLTDPVWGLRASPSQWAGPKRFQPVPVPIHALPHLDAVVISHDHYDHLDYRTILELARRDVPFVTSLGVGAHLEAWGVPAERIIELDWWESYALPKVDLTVTAAPSQHFSGRGLRSRNSTLYRTHDGVRGDPRAAWTVRPGDARSRCIPSCLGPHPPRPGKCARGLGPARQERVTAGALGNLQSRDARLG
jgi:hypothetical protein